MTSIAAEFSHAGAQNVSAQTERKDCDPCLAFETGLTELYPFIRALSYKLYRDQTLAEDAAQDALTSAWRARASFEAGTNLKAWLCTILRNQHKTHYRRAWRNTPLDHDTAVLIPSPPDEQIWASELSDVMRAFHCLPDQQRTALMLVAVAGFSYDEGASLSSVAVGTLKSRVARGRQTLVNMLTSGKPIATIREASRQSGLDQLLTHLDRLLTHLDDDNRMERFAAA